MKFIKNPCEEGNCLVRAGCSLLINYPDRRKKECPEYKKYKDRQEFWRDITAETMFWVVFIVFIIVVIILFFALVLGLIEEWGYLKQFINYVRGT